MSKDPIDRQQEWEDQHPEIEYPRDAICAGPHSKRIYINKNDYQVIFENETEDSVDLVIGRRKHE